MNLTYLILVIVLCLSGAFFAYYMLSPKDDVMEFYMSKDSKVNPKIKAALNLVGGDILSLVPQNSRKRSINDKKIDDLFRESANPWNVTKVEFLLMRILYGILGFSFGVIIGLLTHKTLGVAGSVFVTFSFGALGFMTPKSKYKSVAKERTMQFKAQLPEAIDYLAMTLSAGSSSLPTAFERVIGYLPHGVVREEFELVVKTVNSGQSMEYSLNQLAERAPNEGIKAFVKSMNNANKLSVPMTQLLRQRSLASRKDLKAEMDRKLIVLPTKIMLILAPVALISMIIVLMAPQLQMFM